MNIDALHALGSSAPKGDQEAVSMTPAFLDDRNQRVRVAALYVLTRVLKYSVDDLSHLAVKLRKYNEYEREEDTELIL